MSSAIEILTPHLRNYEWGSKTQIPELFSWPVSETPLAEIWLGAHPHGSSVTDTGVSLSSLIEADPLRLLGEEVCSRFGNRLPFLMKFLAADAPLSIQVHPTLKAAQEGFARESASGISHENRNYQDPYDKPEQMCALSDMWALVGFIETRKCREFFMRIDDYDAVQALEANSSGEVFMNLLKRELKLGLAEIVEKLSENYEEDIWVKKLHNQYPNDPAVLAPFFMNLIHIQPGEAIFVNAGTVHAYLSGCGVEVMGASDNVLRSGLTTKKIDVDELERIVNLTPMTPRVIRPEKSNLQTWVSEVEYFKLQKFDAGQSRIAGPAVIACVEGVVSLIAENSQVSLAKGQFAYLVGEVEASIQGTGSAYLCTTNIQGDA
ncbi:MAG: hypothetical protein RIS09_961 [Actinomycetota bacterium]